MREALELFGVLILVAVVFYFGYTTLMSIDSNIIEQAIRNIQSGR